MVWHGRKLIYQFMYEMEKFNFDMQVHFRDLLREKKISYEEMVKLRSIANSYDMECSGNIESFKFLVRSVGIKEPNTNTVIALFMFFNRRYGFLSIEEIFRRHVSYELLNKFCDTVKELPGSVKVTEGVRVVKNETISVYYPTSEEGKKSILKQCVVNINNVDGVADVVEFACLRRGIMIVPS